MSEIWYRNPLAEMKAMMDSMFDSGFSSAFESTGLRKYIRKPHNVITKKDENGNVSEMTVEVVYTPFKKDEVKVEVLDGVLTVKCGSENMVKDENMDYCGISRQAYSFSLPFSDQADVEKIDAKAEDGILRITIPVKTPEIKESKAVQIEVK